MQSERAHAVIARIEEELAQTPGGAIAFDGDGTLWSGDVGEDYFAALRSHGDFRAPAVHAMRAEVRSLGLPDDGPGEALAATLFDAYEAGAYPEEKVCEVIAWACAGWSRDEIDDFARKVVEGTNLANRLHREAIEIVEWARSVRIETLLVSASPRPIVEAAGRLVGFDRASISAASAAYDGETMQANVREAIPYGPGKVRHIEAAIGERLLYAAFGDNVFDVEMLKKARIAVAVRPKDRLLAQAHQVPGLIVLQPA